MAETRGGVAAIVVDRTARPSYLLAPRRRLQRPFPGHHLAMLSTLSRLCRCALALALMALSGCLWDHEAKRDGHTLLKKPRLPPDSVVLEVFAVHFRRDDQDLYRAI